METNAWRLARIVNQKKIKIIYCIHECTYIIVGDTNFPVHYITLLGTAYERGMDYIYPNITIILYFVWSPGQNIRRAPLSFFYGCRKRRLKD
jgi:hypothetical protein